MQTDALQSVLQEVAAFSKQHRIPLFWGRARYWGEGEVIWQGSNEPADLEGFLAAFCGSGSRLLHAEKKVNSFSSEDEAYLHSLLTHLPEEVGSELLQAIAVVQQHLDHLVQITLTFFCEGVEYTLTEWAPWREAYSLVTSFLEEDEEEAVDDDDSEGPSPKRSDGRAFYLQGEAQGPRLSAEEVEGWARRLTSDPRYCKGRDRRERSYIAHSILEGEKVYGYSLCSSIGHKAEELFEAEVLPLQEEALRKAVVELKEQGYKKVAVKGKLGISENTLNRFWY